MTECRKLDPQDKEFLTIISRRLDEIRLSVADLALKWSGTHYSPLTVIGILIAAFLFIASQIQNISKYIPEKYTSLVMGITIITIAATVILEILRICYVAKTRTRILQITVMPYRYEIQAIKQTLEKYRDSMDKINYCVEDRNLIELIYKKLESARDTGDTVLSKKLRIYNT